MERLQKYMARSGVASRRHAEEMIKEGKVRVNQRIVTQMGYLVDPDKDRVLVEGKPIKAKKTFSYILLYKPTGVVSTCDDPARRRTVLDFLPTKDRLFPVGRLDYHTEGLLLLTDDGALANQLMHPRYSIPKTYLVETTGMLTEEKAKALRSGIQLEDGVTRPAKLDIAYFSKEGSRFSLTITEGKNRQIRRMCEAIGLSVTYLCREKMGFLTLAGLSPGQCRSLSTKEIDRLKKALTIANTGNM